MIKQLLTVLILSLAFPSVGYAVNLTNNLHAQHFPYKNQLRNPGVEHGRTKYGASTAAHLTVTTTSTQVASGARALAYDAAAATDQMFSESITVPPFMQGRNCLGRFFYKGGDTNLEAQVTDGSTNLVTVTLAPSATWLPVNMHFVCPTSGIVRVEVEATADAAVVYMDDFYIGEDFLVISLPGSTSPQVQLAGRASFATTAGCIWSTASATLADFPTTASCPGPTVEFENLGTWQTTDTDLPQITINDLPSGEYIVEAMFNAAMGSNSSSGAFEIGDGTTVSGSGGFFTQGSGRRPHIGVTGYFTYASSGNRTFRLRAATQGGGSTVDLYNDINNLNLTYTVYRFSNPDIAQTVNAVVPDQQAWYVDASQHGANPSLGTSSVSTYTAISNASLTLDSNTGGLTAFSACAPPEVGVASTCSSGSEQVGIVFDVPQAPVDVRVCSSFTWTADPNVSSDANGTFSLVQTNNNDATIIGGNKTKIQAKVSSTDGDQQSHPFRVCDIFQFSSAGTKTIRLMYEQLVVNSISSSSIRADRASNQGQLDIHWEAYPVRPSFNVPLLVNSVTTSNNLGASTNAVAFTCSGSSSISRVTGSWVSTVGNISSGCCTINFPVGVFSSAPICQGNVIDAATGFILTFGTPTTSSVQACAIDHANSPAGSANMMVHCIGVK